MAGFRSAKTDFAVDGNVLPKEDFDLDGFQDQEWFLCAFCLPVYAHQTYWNRSTTACINADSS